MNPKKSWKKLIQQRSSPDDKDFISDINRKQALFQINITKKWKDFRIYHKRCRFNQGWNANIWRLAWMHGKNNSSRTIITS